MTTFTNAYATDGKCHNAQHNSFNHECGKPATWIGVTKTGWACGYCDKCKKNGDEARMVAKWIKRDMPAALNAALDAHFAR
jgi:hypothetical protein